MRSQRVGAVRREVDRFTARALARAADDTGLAASYELGVLHALCWVSGEVHDPPTEQLDRFYPSVTA